MSEIVIEYDRMVQDALLGVVKNILSDASKQGLPGDHHFYIAFDTTHEEVSIPPYLRERYPEEMTIVLQNQFWNLTIQQDYFEVDLSFNQKRETLHIPFAALTGFLDPSVEFGLYFQHNPGDADFMDDDFSDAHPDSTSDTPPSGAQEEAAKDDSTKVVTLDAFRKKK